MQLYADHASLDVVIAARNRQDSLTTLLDSLRRQTVQPARIIIVDDASCPELVAAGDSVELIRLSEPKGACYARNRAFERVCGEFFLILDDDTELHDPNLIRAALEAIQTRDEAALIAFRPLDGELRPRPSQLADRSGVYRVADPKFCGCICRTAALARVGGLIERFGYYYEENEWSLRLLDAGYDVLYDSSLSIVHHLDARGRDQIAIDRRLFRNAAWTACLRYPASLIAPVMVRYVRRYLSETSGSLGVRLAGAARTACELAASIPWILSTRRAVRLSTVLECHARRKSPIQVLCASDERTRHADTEPSIAPSRGVASSS